MGGKRRRKKFDLVNGRGEEKNGLKRKKKFNLVRGGEDGDDAILKLLQRLLHPAVIPFMREAVGFLGKG